MTLITAVISPHAIAVASDSLITLYNTKQDERKILETKKPKIVKVEALKACLSYFGLAAKSEYGSWKTYNWLLEKAKEAASFKSLESFASSIAEELQNILLGMSLKQRGIGIHLVGYEEFEGKMIPELYLITNFKNTNYEVSRTISVSREVYKNLPKNYHIPEADLICQRKQVVKYLNSGGIFVFNNGSPEMFGHVYGALSGLVKMLKKKNMIKNPGDIEQYRYMAKMPIEVVSKVQVSLCKENFRLVGGRIHDLVISKKDLSFSSTSGVK